MILDDLPPQFTDAILHQLAEELIVGAEEGETDPLSVFIRAAAVERAAKLIKTGVKPYAVLEAETYDYRADKMESHGVGFKIKQAVSMLDYSGDNEWNKYDEQVAFWTEKRKIRQNYLRKKFFEPDLDTGEITVEVTVEKVQDPTIVVSFRKE